MTTSYSNTVPKEDTSEALPQKVAQTLLQGTSAAWIVNNNPVTLLLSSNHIVHPLNLPLNSIHLLGGKAQIATAPEF